MGGMLGSNSCGSFTCLRVHQEHTIEIKALLSDGSEAVFGPVSKETFETNANRITWKERSTGTSGIAQQA